MKGFGESAVAKGVAAALALSLLLGPAEIDYATTLNAARLSRGEPSLLVGVLRALDGALCPPMSPSDVPVLEELDDSTNDL